MAGSRTLKLSILADVDDLRKKLNEADNEVQGFGGKLGNFAKVAGAAFAAAGAAAAAYAGKLLVDGVKAAIEDEAAQAKLATTLGNVTGATKAQIAATEDYITKTSLAFGVTDDQLRPSLDRLVRSTQNVEEAQKLQNLALNIAAGTGKDLTAVSEALAKAHDGNFGALKKLGVSLDESIIKSKDFDAATAALASTFEGQATIQADTFQGKMARLSIAFSEAKETVGGFVLDALTPLVSGFVDKGIPAIQNVATEIGQNLAPVFKSIFSIIAEDVFPIFKNWFSFLIYELVPAISKLLIPIFQGLKGAYDKIRDALIENQDELKPFLDLLKAIWNFAKDFLVPFLGGAFKKALDIIGSTVAGLINGFSTLVSIINGVIGAIRTMIDLVARNSIVSGIAGFIDNAFGGGKASGGSVNAGTSYLVGEQGAELFTPSTKGVITPLDNLGGGGVVNNININVSGAIDPTAVARQINDILNREATLSGTFTSLGVSRLVAI